MAETPIRYGNIVSDQNDNFG